ncbi:MULTISPECIES: hypothetical protein [unclassified Mesorhizobium]|uniref:hypothetical protein n=1 Tax=unclassified Mesorhizobium TaxID=325217 RepID=UPI0015E420F4|nr:MULTISPECIES: hypothetical protein [unclassified Mesorhizobium]
MSDEVCFVAATKADLSVDRAVWLDFSPSIALGFVHFVIALPGEGDIVAVTRAEYLAADASEGEFARAIVRELNVGGAPSCRDSPRHSRASQRFASDR